MVFCCQCLTVMQHERSAQENALQIFTLAVLQEAIKKFEQSSETGESGSGSLHMCMVESLTFPYNKIHVAVKRVKRGQMGMRVWEMEVIRFLGDIKHQNLVKLIGYCNEDYKNVRFLVYEYLPTGSLDRHLSSLPWSMRLRIAKDAATGLAYLHERMRIFKEFKPSNILLDDHMNAKLLYLGFVGEAPPRGQTHVATSVEVTKGYSAPEYIQKGRFSTKMDVWSYGIFLHELITGGFPVTHENPENDPECMTWVCCYAGAGMSKLKVDPMLEGNYTEQSMQKVVSIANRCLVLEPKRRPKMSTVLKLVKEAIDLEIPS